MNINEAYARCQELTTQLRNRGWRGRVSVMVHWGGSQDTCIHVDVEPPSLNASQHFQRAAMEHTTFINGEPSEIGDMLDRAEIYIQHIPDPEQARLDDVVARLAETAEMAEAHGLNSTQTEAWDALAQYLRNASKQLADRGLPHPGQFPLNGSKE